MVLDKVLRHWLSLTITDSPDDVVQNGFGQTVRERLSLFYADDGMVGSRDQNWLQTSLDVLVALFRSIGLQTNTSKTKTMTCYPGFIRTGHSTAASTRRHTGQGDSYRERQRRRVTCPECNKDLAASSLTQHRRTQHGIEPEIDWATIAPQIDIQPPNQYTVNWPATQTQVDCPVLDCPAQIRGRDKLRRHFNHKHWNDNIHIPEEHPEPYPRCARCRLQMPGPRITASHYASKHCIAGAARVANRHQLRLNRDADAQTFYVNGVALERVRKFKYLGRYMHYTNSDWPALSANLTKARQRWAMVSRVLTKENATKRAFGNFYKAIVQSVLLYGCETWTVTPTMMKVLEGFHHKVARRIAHMMPYQVDGEWFYPPLKDALATAGLFPVKEYIRRRQATITQYVALRPIHQLCQDAPRSTGLLSRVLRWWEQDHTDHEAPASDVSAANPGDDNDDDAMSVD